MKYLFSLRPLYLTTATLLSLCAICVAPAYAVNSGLDTPTGVTGLPFSVEGTQVMDLTSTGLAIGRAPDGGWELEVAGRGNQHGIFGQAGSANYWGVGGYSNNSAAYGGLGVANSVGAYGISSAGPAVYGQTTGNTASWAGEFVGSNTGGSGGVLAYGGGNNWGGLFYGNTSGNGQYGVAAQGTIWAGYFMGPVVITSGYLQFPDGTQQTTAAAGGHAFGGTFATYDPSNPPARCNAGNQYTGGCTCPGNAPNESIISATNTSPPYWFFICTGP